MSARAVAEVVHTVRGFELYVPGVPGWEEFDQLTRYLVKHFQALVTSTVDGPDARLRHLTSESVPLTLEYEDPYGSTILSLDPRGAELLKRIAEDLERRLAGS